MLLHDRGVSDDEAASFLSQAVSVGNVSVLKKQLNQLFLCDRKTAPYLNNIFFRRADQKPFLNAKDQNRQKILTRAKYAVSNKSKNRFSFLS